MKYTKQTWTDGVTVLDAATMEHIEQGIADVTDAVTELQENSGSGNTGGNSGLTDTAKTLILSLFESAAYGNSTMQSQLDALKTEFGQSGGNTPTPTYYSVTYSLSHVTSSTTTASVAQGSSFAATLTAASGYTLSSVTIKMGGADITSSAYNTSTRVVSIASVTGNVTITATAVAATVAVSSVTLNKSTLSLTEGSSETLTATVLPNNATNKTVTWTVSPSGYATVSGGVVKAVKAGSCTVTATAGGKSASCAVTVTASSVTLPTPVYKLAAAKTFVAANKEYIDTGIKLFETIDPQPSWTILLEAQGNALAAAANTYTLLSCFSEDSTLHGLLYAVWDNGNLGFNLYSTNGPFINLSYLNGSKVRIALIISGGKMTTKTNTSMGNYTDVGISNYSGTVDKSLVLGAFKEDNGSKSQFFNGTVYQFAVFQRALDTSDIESWINGEASIPDASDAWCYDFDNSSNRKELLQDTIFAKLRSTNCRFSDCYIDTYHKGFVPIAVNMTAFVLNLKWYINGETWPSDLQGVVFCADSNGNAKYKVLGAEVPGNYNTKFSDIDISKTSSEFYGVISNAENAPQ